MAWDEKTLSADLKTALRGLYVLYGEEGYLVARYMEQIAKKAVCDDLGGFNLQRFDGETADAAQIEEAIDALPLMAERKCVVVRDLDITAGDRAERLLPLLEDMPETTVVVLYYMQLQPQMKNAKWKRLLEAATKNGAAVCFAKKRPRSFPARFAAGRPVAAASSRRKMLRCWCSSAGRICCCSPMSSISWRRWRMAGRSRRK